MKQKQLLAGISAGLIGLSMVGSADAALVSRLGGMAFYDNVADLTWLADANAGAGSSYDDGFSAVDGKMTWQNANDWAGSLNVAGVTGWRLANSDTTCSDVNCTGSEMGNLFYNVLGGVANTSILTTNNANYDLFTNIMGASYWSATEDTVTSAWYFNFAAGDQNVQGNGSNSFAWAVQTGDVGEVPVPAAVWLFGSGLLGLIGIARRKK